MPTRRRAPTGDDRQRQGSSRDDLRIEVRLAPRSGSDRVDGVLDGVLWCRVAAPPVEGAANAALLRLLADELALSPTSLRLVAGERGRRKVVALPADERARVASRWPGLIR